MRIGIIGGGSIGLIFASYLSADHDITVYTRREEQAKLLLDKGITLINNGMISHHNVNSTCTIDGLHLHDLVIVATKQYDLIELLNTVEFRNATSLLFLQNGMSHIEQISQISNRNIYLGVVEHGAIKQNDTTVEHTGIGVTKISSYRGNLDFIKSLLSQSSKQFPFIFLDDWFTMLISKLLVNAVINPLTALFRVPNGALIENEQLKFITESYFKEIVHALKIKEDAQIWESIQFICKNTARNRSSMLRDIEIGRRTEIDAILGYIINNADKSTLPLTTLAYYAIKGLEHEQKR